MKPITYFASTPAIEEISRLYGDYWLKLMLPDRLAIANALTTCLLQCVGYQQDCSLVHAATENGHRFGAPTDGWGDTHEHLLITGLLQQLDDELTPQEAAQLVMGLMQQATH